MLQLNQSSEVQNRRHLFTRREIQVAIYILGGYTTLQIAFILKISPHTVEAHKKSMRNKIKVKNNVQMIGYMLRNNIIKCLIGIIHFVGSDFFEVSSGVMG
jgi:DNA-binding CsgD family transcriptional regulator